MAADQVTSPPPSTGVGSSASNRRHLGAALGLALAVVAVLVLGLATTPAFRSASNLRAVLESCSITGIVAVCMTPITMSGNFVSLGAQQSTMLAMVAFVAELAAGWNVALAILSVIALLLVVGLVQGVVIAFGLNPVITTLAAGAIIYGAVASLTSGTTLTAGDATPAWGSATIAGVPVAVVAFAVVTIIVTAAIAKTAVGRRIALVGANRDTARIAGISVRRSTVWAFVIFSIGVAVAGIFAAAHLGQANLDSANTLTIDAVAAVLVGGTAIQGGLGSPLRSAAGAVVIATVTNIMLLNGFSGGARQTAVGAVLVVIVVALHLTHRTGGN